MTGAVRIWFNRAYASTYHLIRMLRANPDGRAVHVLGSHVDRYSPVLSACDRAIDEPDLAGEDYVQWALDVARAESIDVFVPRAHLADVAAARDRFEAIGTRVLCADAGTIETFADKARGYRAALALGLPVPPHRVVHDGAGLCAAYAEYAALAAQVCMKPPRGVGGGGFRRLTTDPPRWTDDLAGPVRSLVRLEDACRALDAALPHEVLVMPYLDGVEVSVDVLADRDGTVLAAIGRQHDTTPGRRLRTIVDDPAARSIAETITREHRIGFLSNTQVRYWQGRPYLLEVNTRAAGGLFQTELARVNLPWAAVQLALGTDPEPLRPHFGATYTELPGYAAV